MEHIAVLIDADNVSAKWIPDVLEEAATAGNLALKRVYGDFRKGDSWMGLCADQAIQPMQQFPNTKGKNASDIAMVIDAMDLLHSGRYGTFCIVSSDSDFSALATRMRQAGVTVVGFGEEKTPEAFRKACSQFKYVEILQRTKVVSDSVAETKMNVPEIPGEAIAIVLPMQDEGTSSKPLKTLDEELKQQFRQAIEATSGDEGWASLGGIGSLLVQWAPDFDARNYGFKKLSELVLKSGWFDVQQAANGKGSVAIRLKRLKLAKSILGSMVHKAVQQAMVGGWAPAQSVRKHLENLHPQFSLKTYGYDSFDALLRSIDGLDFRTAAGAIRFVGFKANRK